MSDQRRGYIDGLKGIAIIVIILFHLGDPGAPWPFWWITRSGDGGVQLFFVISGFLNFLSLNHRFKEPQNVTVKESMLWIKSRLIRLVPLFYLALIMSLLTHSECHMWLGNEGHVTALNVLTHVVLINGFFPHYVNSILWVEWYLAVLVIYVVLTPLAYRFLSNTKLVLLFFVVLTGVSFGLTQLFWNILPTDTDPLVYYGFISTFGPHVHLAVYSLGFVFFVLTQKIDLFKIKYRVLISSIVLALLMYVIIRLSLDNSKNVLVNGFLWFVMLTSQEIHSSPLIDNRLFRFIGKNSYVLYLFQFIFFNIYDQFIGIGGLAGWCLKGIICIVMLLCFSYAISMIKTKFKNKVISR